MTTWKLRNYQQAAYDTANGEPRVIVNMPTGWGKSFLLCALAASDLRDPLRKVVICVPQRIIAKGFVRKMKIELPDGDIVDWSVPRNLCGTSTAKVDELTDFLLAGPAKSSARRVVLTTHLTLSYALNRLKDEEMSEVADDTTYVIDESHHVSASEQNRNVLGNQIIRLLDAKTGGLKMWLATAFFFRGDHLPIISEAHLAEFIRVHVPFDEYWRILKYIKSYSYDFVTYKGTVFKELQHLLQQSNTPTIIYCPPEGHKMLLGKSKATFVARLQQMACECLKATPWTSFDEALLEKAVVVDLVDPEQRSEKIRFVAEHGERVAAILTVGMFREGADWVEAARIIDLVPTNSDQDRLQRFGRLVRDCRGKRHISYFNLFPLVVDQNEEERRRQLTKLYAHFHASLVLENAIEPIRVRLRPRPKHGPKEAVGDPKTYFNLLGEFSEAEQEQIIRDTYEQLLKLQTKKDDAGQTATPDEVRTTVIKALKENGVRKNLEPLAKQVLLLMRRKANVSVRTDDLVDGGFDKVWSTDIFNPITAYSAGLGGPKTLAEIRDVVEGVFERKWQDNYSRICHLPGPPDSQSSAYWWCTHNRTLHSQGNLPEAKVKLLEQISWWTWTISVSDRWETNFEMIRAMAQCPKAGTPEYSWVRQQRRFHDQKKLDAEKIRLLDSIPWWTWASSSNNWDKKFSDVADLPERPARGTTLYDWVRTQRKEYKAGRLAPERAKKLESILWWVWEERRSSKDDGLANLRICVREGIELGHTKRQVAEKWAEIMGVGRDQVHKYLRKSEPAVREQWKCLGDERGRRKSNRSKKGAKS
ncbi:DEAD/DEAH box helicase family protein [Thalassoroseus pseudoceratinae]|uniref:DEAD/DEAH box helicase family protein n=1 Tax=Thalassoroseus pseudoceratinae TaxID=2713176 RepID=UPI00141FCFC8|nr:DEAD/DEAH box helicase family protein [Thalassoroseus pseudoceratinae]